MAFFRNPSLDVTLIYLHCYFNDIMLRGHGSFPFLAWPPYEVPSVTMPELFLTAASLKYTPKLGRRSKGCLSRCFIRLGPHHWGELLPRPPHLYLTTVGEGFLGSCKGVSPIMLYFSRWRCAR